MNRDLWTSIGVGLVAAALLTGPAAAQDVIRIGVTQPLTGAFAASGNYVAQGARIAADQINAGGGVLGRRIQLVVEDSGFASSLGQRNWHASYSYNFSFTFTL